LAIIRGEQREQLAALSSGQQAPLGSQFCRESGWIWLRRLVFAAPATTLPPMLSDRPYMRDNYQPERTSALTWLIAALIAGFVLQIALDSPWLHNGQALLDGVALTIPALQSGWVWTLFTYSFLHSTHFIFHLIGNLFALYFLGRELLPMLGTRRFVGLFTAATLVGGLVWTAVHWRFGGSDSLYGATSAVEALFIVFACFFPEQEMNFLLFFLFPVTLKPKHLAYALVAFDLCGLVFYEIPGVAWPFNLAMASSAHLGGMLTGFLYYRFVHDAQWSLRAGGRPDIELPRWMKRSRKVTLPAPVYRVNFDRPDNIRAEVDRILDKINSQGFGALTAEEKRVLDNAKHLLSRP
jgi:membrane associated rhomboid family serine protease